MSRPTRPRSRTGARRTASSRPSPGASTTDRTPHVAYVKDYWSKLEPFTDGYYTNETGDEGQRKVDDNYQGNLPRLREIKKKYDPTNLFRLNANVQPA